MFFIDYYDIQEILVFESRSVKRFGLGVKISFFVTLKKVSFTGVVYATLILSVQNLFFLGGNIHLFKHSYIYVLVTYFDALL